MLPAVHPHHQQPKPRRPPPPLLPAPPLPPGQPLGRRPPEPLSPPRPRGLPATACRVAPLSAAKLRPLVERSGALDLQWFHLKHYTAACNREPPAVVLKLSPADRGARCTTRAGRVGAAAEKHRVSLGEAMARAEAEKRRIADEVKRVEAAVLSNAGASPTQPRGGGGRGRKRAFGEWVAARRGFAHESSVAVVMRSHPRGAGIFLAHVESLATAEDDTGARFSDLWRATLKVLRSAVRRRGGGRSRSSGGSSSRASSRAAEPTPLEALFGRPRTPAGSDAPPAPTYEMDTAAALAYYTDLLVPMAEANLLPEPPVDGLGMAIARSNARTLPVGRGTAIGAVLDVLAARTAEL